MNIKSMVEREVMVVIDDYVTGEVVFEGSLHYFREQYNLIMRGLYDHDGFEMSCEWFVKDGKPIAFVTVDFGERLESFKQYLAWDEESDDCMSFCEWERQQVEGEERV